MIVLDPLGDRAFVARFSDESEARGWAEAVRRLAPTGVVDVVLAYRRVAVHADPDRADLSDLERCLASIRPEPAEARVGRGVVVPVLYDGDDLPEIAASKGLTIAEVTAIHASREYRVLAVGFLPGFPYAGDLDPRLAGLKRRDRPRPRVPAGSVAIVGTQTGIYPAESPGGWHLIGRTPLRIVDLGTGHFPIVAGDSIRFAPIDAEQFDRRRGEPLGAELGTGTIRTARLG